MKKKQFFNQKLMEILCTVILTKLEGEPDAPVQTHEDLTVLSITIKHHFLAFFLIYFFVGICILNKKYKSVSLNNVEFK